MARRLAAEGPPREHLVLAGGGHTHALVLRMWAMQPRRRPHAWITLVNRRSTALYSGMVPGLVAGLYAREDCAIDLRHLADRAGVSFVEAEITGLDLAARELQLQGRPPLRFDWLSIDVGAVVGPAWKGTGWAPPGDRARQGDGPATTLSAEAENHTRCGVVERESLQPLPVMPGPVTPRPVTPRPVTAIPVKPLEPFLQWCARADADARQPLPVTGAVTVRGSGAAAVEVALALQARGHTLTLQTRPGGLALGSRWANQLLAGVLRRAGIQMRGPGDSTEDPDNSAGASIDCTGSRGPAWLRGSGLPVDQRGRVLTTSTLQVMAQPRIWACGDCGVVEADPRPPSGVWAVRAAPVLARNLEQAVEGRPLRRWRPQRRALQLLGDGGVLGQPRAIALWGPLALGPSRWLWRWKDRIDRRFMQRFCELPAMGDGQGAIACRGCAAKLAAQPLESALQRLNVPEPERNRQAHQTPQAHQAPQVPQAEDAAVVGQAAGGELWLQSVDGFPALVSDPWLNGRLTTLHACSDLWASGARISSAQAVVTVPAVGPELQADLLHQTLAGVRSVLDPLGAALVGGHSLEARDALPAGPGMPCPGLALALTINGDAPASGAWRKGPLQPGDALILTRPIGSGVLFAAAMAGACKPEWLDRALALMQQSQDGLVALLASHGCHACTDITGFGLLGHLGEMLRTSPCASTSGSTSGSASASASASTSASAAAVTLQADAIPALPGTLELFEQGHASSLAPANARALALLDRTVHLAGGQASQASMQGLLIDPQTCGPLLAAVPGAEAAAAVRDLQAAGYPHAATIGSVIAVSA